GRLPRRADTGSGGRGPRTAQRGGSGTTSLARTPTPSTSTSTRSPGSSGPTPAGVPVRSTSPGSRVITRLTKASRSATPCSSWEARGVWEGRQGGAAGLELGGAALLAGLAVDQGGDGQVARVQVGLDPGAEGAEGVEALGPRPLPVGALQVARGDGVREIG